MTASIRGRSAAADRASRPVRRCRWSTAEIIDAEGNDLPIDGESLGETAWCARRG